MVAGRSNAFPRLFPQLCHTRSLGFVRQFFTPPSTEDLRGELMPPTLAHTAGARLSVPSPETGLAVWAQTFWVNP
jgi:hypothetical protein